MKKILSIALAFLMCLPLCACGGEKEKPEDGDFSGTWIRDEWTNPKTGAVVDITLYLNEDGSFKEEIENSIDGYKEYQGTWSVEKDEIILNVLMMTAGEKTPDFDENGHIIDGIKMNTILTIIDGITLESGAQFHKKLD